METNTSPFPPTLRLRHSPLPNPHDYQQSILCIASGTHTSLTSFHRLLSPNCELVNKQPFFEKSLQKIANARPPLVLFTFFPDVPSGILPPFLSQLGPLAYRSYSLPASLPTVARHKPNPLPLDLAPNFTPTPPHFCQTFLIVNARLTLFSPPFPRCPFFPTIFLSFFTTISQIHKGASLSCTPVVVERPECSRRT